MGNSAGKKSDPTPHVVLIDLTWGVTEGVTRGGGRRGGRRDERDGGEARWRITLSVLESYSRMLYSSTALTHKERKWKRGMWKGAAMNE